MTEFSKEEDQSDSQTHQETKKHQKREIGGSTMLFINNCVGDELLTISCRFAELGLPLGLGLFTLSFVFEAWAFAVISRACTLTNTGSLFELMKRCYSIKTALFIDICSVLMLVSLMICYTIISSSYVLQAYNWVMHVNCAITEVDCLENEKYAKWLVKLVVGFGVLPLISLITSVKMLNLISSFAILFVMATIIVIVYKAITIFIEKGSSFDPFYEMRIPSVPLVPLNYQHVFTDFSGMFAMFSLQPCIPALY